MASELSLKTPSTGLVTLSPADTATDKTITLPATTGTMVVQDGTNTTTINNLAYTGTLTGGTGVINIGSGQVYKDASGNVGIGTVSPVTKLSVVNGVVSVAGSTAGSGVVKLGDPTDSIPYVGMYRSAAATIGTAGNFLNLGGYDGVAFTTGPTQFSGQSERMRIGSSGVVTIGSVASPQGTLHIGGVTANNPQAVLTNGVSDPNFQLWVRNGDAGATANTRQASISMAYVGAGYGSSINFIRGSDTLNGILAFETQGSERMRIDASGNVNINTGYLTIDAFASPTNRYLNFRAGFAPNVSGGAGLMAVDHVSGFSDGLGVYGHDGISFHTAQLERMRITSAGNVDIGGTSSASRLSVLRNSPTGFADANIEMLSGAGDVVLSFHATGVSAVCIDHVRGASGVRCVNLTRTTYIPIEASAFNVMSDYRVKENVTHLTGALDRVAQLSPKRFSYIQGSMSYNDGKIVDGFLAHEAALVVPEAVTGKKDAVNAEGKPIMQGIDQAKLIPLLTAAIQELTARLEVLENK